MDMRLNKPQHVKRMINQLINEIRADSTISLTKKAQAIGYLSNIVLKSIEMGEFDERLKEIEKRLREE